MAQHEASDPVPLHRSPSLGDGSTHDQRFFRILWILKICVLIILVGVAAYIFSHLEQTAFAVKSLVLSVQHLGWAAPITFIGLYVVCIILFLPAEFMHLAAGYIFTQIYGYTAGIIVAFFCCLAGALLSGLSCFLISRYLLYDTLHRWLRCSNLFQAFDSAIEEGGATFVALIRLSPVLPYSLVSYLFGVTALKAPHLIIGTFAGTPLIIAFNFLGSAFGDINEIDFAHFEWTWGRILLIAIGILMALISVLYITVLTRRKLRMAYASRYQTQALLPRDTETSQELLNVQCSV